MKFKDRIRKEAQKVFDENKWIIHEAIKSEANFLIEERFRKHNREREQIRSNRTMFILLSVGMFCFGLVVCYMVMTWPF